MLLQSRVPRPQITPPSWQHKVRHRAKCKVRPPHVAAISDIALFWLFAYDPHPRTVLDSSGRTNMNLLKNLMILAVLAAVGYGVYASLSPNGVDATSSFDAPRVDLSGTRPSLTPGGPLPLGGNSVRDSGASGLGVAPLTPPPLTGSQPLGATNAPAMPYPAPGSSTVTPLTPPGLSSNIPTATLGSPVSPDAVSPLTAPNAAAGPQGIPALPTGLQKSP
jgi:hypothetical protein